jgi:hypothetical protein
MSLFLNLAPSRTIINQQNDFFAISMQQYYAFIKFLVLGEFFLAPSNTGGGEGGCNAN